MYKKYLILILSILLVSCHKNFQKAEEKIFENIIFYQYHEKDVSDFSFLSKYRNLEALDLSGSAIKDISFIKNLKFLKFLVLDNKNVKGIEIVKSDKINFFTECPKNNLNKTSNSNNLFEKSNKITDINKLLKQNNGFFQKNKFNNKYDLFLPIFDNKIKEIKELNLFNKYFYKIKKFGNLYGLVKFKNLEILKIILTTDRYLYYINRLKNLKELHLLGNIHNLPNFKYIRKLYLYNTNISDFSFLKKSKIDYLYITTYDFMNKKWSELKNKYPNIQIIVKSKLFTYRSCAFIDREGCFNNSFYFYNNFLKGDCYKIEMLRENILFRNCLSLMDYKFLINDINISVNHLWRKDIDTDFLNKTIKSKNITFLDKAIEDDNKNAINYLIIMNAKRACEILKTKCSPISKEIQKLLNKKNDFEGFK